MIEQGKYVPYKQLPEKLRQRALVQAVGSNYLHLIDITNRLTCIGLRLNLIDYVGTNCFPAMFFKDGWKKVTFTGMFIRNLRIPLIYPQDLLRTKIVNIPPFYLNYSQAIESLYGSPSPLRTLLEEFQITQYFRIVFITLSGETVITNQQVGNLSKLSVSEINEINGHLVGIVSRYMIDSYAEFASEQSPTDRLERLLTDRNVAFSEDLHMQHSPTYYILNGPNDRVTSVDLTGRP